MANVKLSRTVKRGVAGLLNSWGYTVKRKNDVGTMEGAFRALKSGNHRFNTVVDVGASNGSWTGKLMEYFPLCQYLLIEAQPVHTESLSRFRMEHRNVHVAMAAAGDAPGRIHFDASDPLGGQASYQPYPSNNIEVPVTTIDDEIRSAQLNGPYLIKLDTHGFEKPILTGATRTLADTEVIVMECYNFKIAPECMLFFEMCDFLMRLGFRCIDLVDPHHRPFDQSFWQMDLIFVRQDRPEFSYLGYR